MKQYFGNKTASVTTILLMGLVAFWIWVSVTGKTVMYWGLKSLFLLIYGLVICCFAATRDGFDRTVQCSIDKSCEPGIFPLVSLPTVIGCVGALVIVISAVATPIAKSQQAREIWFYIMSVGVAVKILTIEIARHFYKKQ